MYELRALEDAYYHLRGKVVHEVEEVMIKMGGEVEFMRFLYSVLLGVVDGVESLVAVLGDMVEEKEESID
jgi:hypothetical protein